MEKVTYPFWFSTSEDIKYNNNIEAWGEPGTESIEMLIGSDAPKDPLNIGPIELKDYNGIIHLTRNQQRLWECVHMDCIMEDMWYIPMLNTRMARFA